VTGRPTLEAAIEAFGDTVTSVPRRASSEMGDGWRTWQEGGFVVHKLIARSLTRKTYVPVLALLLKVVVDTQANHLELYAVLKFVPKKNQLNPILAAMVADPNADVSIETLKPREVRRRLDDVARALKQTWLMLGCYLALPDKGLREDFLWSTRTVVEKVKTDQRSRSLELLCLGFFQRGGALWPLVTTSDWRLKAGFEKNFGVDAWHPKPPNARMIWQRSRMVYPFLEVAHRVWLNATGEALGSCPEFGVGYLDSGDIDSEPPCEISYADDEENSAAIGELLDVIARASPEEKVLNSLLYWLIDLAYKSMLEGEVFKAWDPEPYVLRRSGVEGRLVEEIGKMGHLLQLLYSSENREKLRGEELLLQVKEVETTCSLLASIRSSCADACPAVLEEYDRLMVSPTLSLQRLEELEFEALAGLLEVEGELVKANAPTVRAALSEWRNPELLFRYLDDNRSDPRMEALIKRWLRAIFGLSGETLRMIRRESGANVRHLLMIPQDVLLRWYSGECPGTSKCKTLFMLGEDAGSCLRIISNDGNKYNRALMGYVLQSHVRALVLTDAVGRVMVRSLIRLVLRSDTMTPVIFCDPMFFTTGYSRELQRELLAQARELAAWMQIPVVHAGSVLPLMEVAPQSSRTPAVLLEAGGKGGAGASELQPMEVLAGGGLYVRRVTELDYDIRWVDLLEMDGVAPFTYSEELPYDDMLQQHTPGVQARTGEDAVVVIAALPREDSPSADRYVREREGETAWTMHLDDDDLTVDLPSQLTNQITQREHVSSQVSLQRPVVTLDPNARDWDEELPAGYKAPALDQ